MGSVLGAATVQELREQVRGEVLVPGDAGYDDARAIWNTMIDRRPALMIRCAGVADVMLGVQFARSQGIPLAVRGGGHSLPGFSSVDGGMVVDLSAMKGIRVDPDRRRATVQAGATWGDLDHETQAFGLATTGGLISTTGVAGLTLGGGIGWLMRRLGLACDNLVGADVVTADGRFVRADAEENPDLLWALRGGGGNFGVVVSFDFAVHPVGPTILGGPVFFPGDQAAEVARRYAEYTSDLPDEMTTLIDLMSAPPLPTIPSEWHGQLAVGALACYAGPPEEGEKAAAGLRELGTPILEHVGPVPYTMLQSLLDPLFGPGARNYFRSGYVSEISEGLIEQLVAFHQTKPSPASEIHVQHLGGAIARVRNDATAFASRDAGFVVNIVGRWQDADQDDRVIGWARDLYSAIESFTSGGTYVNFISSGDDRVTEAYPNATLERLAEVKRTWDPTNVFRLNQNIEPR